MTYRLPWLPEGTTATLRVPALPKTEWRTAPDGLPARVVGPWVEDKVHYGDRIATFVATGMHKLWGRRAYVELFSGPGVSFDRGHHRFIEGSALGALQRDFTDYIFVDLDPTATTALEERIARLAPPGRRTRVIQGDCNEVAGEVLDSIPRRALSLLFVDPSSWEVRFETIASLVADRRLDLLVTFHVGAMKRARWAQPASLDAFFGTPDWRGALDLPREQRSEALVRLYNRQLEPYGYLPGCYLYRQTVRNTRNVVMYNLVLFSRHDRGVEFWRRAAAVKPGGQLSLWGDFEILVGSAPAPPPARASA